MFGHDLECLVSPRRSSRSEIAHVFDASLRLLEPSASALHDPEDTTTPAAPGAIQIGPLDVP